MPNTLTRVGLSEAVAREVGLSKNESVKLVESVIRHVSDAILSGEGVKISSFGTFRTREMAARTGRNIGTGASIPIPRRRTLAFRYSPRLRKRVADGGGE